MMEYAKKMALVEPRLLEGLQWQQQLQQFNPVVKAMSSLDTDMQEVLSHQNLPLEEKVKSYNQVLQRYMNYKDQQQTAAQAPIKMQMVGPTPTGSSSETPSGGIDLIEQEVLDTVPTRMKKKAQLLLNRLKNSSHLRWTDKGELVYKDQVVSNTNVADLVNDVLRRRKHFEPHGWQTFAQALKETNVPQDLVGHQERWQWMQQQGHGSPQGQARALSRVSRPRARTMSRVSRPRERTKEKSTHLPKWTSYKSN